MSTVDNGSVFSAGSALEEKKQQPASFVFFHYEAEGYTSSSSSDTDDDDAEQKNATQQQSPLGSANRNAGNSEPGRKIAPSPAAGTPTSTSKGQPSETDHEAEQRQLQMMAPQFDDFQNLRQMYRPKNSSEAHQGGAKSNNGDHGAANFAENNNDPRAMGEEGTRVTGEEELECTPLSGTTASSSRAGSPVVQFKSASVRHASMRRRVRPAAEASRLGDEEEEARFTSSEADVNTESDDADDLGHDDAAQDEGSLRSAPILDNGTPADRQRAAIHLSAARYLDEKEKRESRKLKMLVEDERSPELMYEDLTYAVSVPSSRRGDDDDDVMGYEDDEGEDSTLRDDSSSPTDPKAATKRFIYPDKKLFRCAESHHGKRCTHRRCMCCNDDLRRTYIEESISPTTDVVLQRESPGLAAIITPSPSSKSRLHPDSARGQSGGGGGHKNESDDEVPEPRDGLRSPSPQPQPRSSLRPVWSASGPPRPTPLPRDDDEGEDMGDATEEDDETIFPLPVLDAEFLSESAARRRARVLRRRDRTQPSYEEEDRSISGLSGQRSVSQSRGAADSTRRTTTSVASSRASTGAEPRWAALYRQGQESRGRREALQRQKEVNDRIALDAELKQCVGYGVTRSRDDDEDFYDRLHRSGGGSHRRLAAGEPYDGTPTKCVPFHLHDGRCCVHEDRPLQTTHRPKITAAPLQNGKPVRRLLYDDIGGGDDGEEGGAEAPSPQAPRPTARQQRASTPTPSASPPSTRPRTSTPRRWY